MLGPRGQDQPMEANPEYLHEFQKEEKRTPLCRSFHIPCLEKLIIDVRSDMSIAPWGLVGRSITPCLIRSVMIPGLSGAGKEFSMIEL